MAEIKSTLDLIMERTKNLTLTEEEKKALEAKERKARIKGWCRRYLDGTLSIADLQENMAREEATAEAAAMLREECLSHINPEKDNRPLFLLLREVLSIPTTDLERLERDYHEELDRHRAAAGQEAIAILASRGISGSAVLPNPKLSPHWQERVEAARQIFQQRLYLVK
ncbi:MAG: hypothetical protein KBG09_04135 [Syntrophobacterales bacterium]|nr:hypothetical protein [Syntrophobacterales bacterium]